MITAMRRRYWLLYPAWILVCALLFFAMRNREDPSRRPGQVLSNDAAARASFYLHRIDPARFRSYEAVHVAHAGRGEDGNADRWVVLCDRVPHTALHQAIVVEVDSALGQLLVIRRPG
jgi:hypothetical protein